MAFPIRLRHIEPNVGPANGGTCIQLFGVNFYESTDIKVCFRFPDTHDLEELSVPGHFVNKTEVHCTAPSLFSFVSDSTYSKSMKSHLKQVVKNVIHAQVVVYSDRVPSSNDVKFIFYPTVYIAKVYPQCFPITKASKGGSQQDQRITITLDVCEGVLRGTQGKNFIETQSIWVKLSQKLDYSYNKSAKAAARGNSKKNVIENVVKAAWVEKTKNLLGYVQVSFIPPKMTVGRADVQLSVNKIDYFSGRDSIVQLQLYRNCSIKSIHPSCVESIRSTPVKVIINGNDFLNSDELVVKILQDASHHVSFLPASFISSNKIAFTLPSTSLKHGIATVSVSCNGGENFEENDPAEILLLRKRLPLAIIPNCASEKGYTIVKIELTALEDPLYDDLKLLTRLNPPGKIRVQFENKEHNQCEIVKGTLVDNLNVRCKVPATSKKYFQQHCSLLKYSVSVSFDNHKFEGCLEFFYYVEPSLNSISINHGPATGGSNVILNMNSPVPQVNNLYVKFECSNSNEFLIVDASRVQNDKNSIQCRTPMWNCSNKAVLTNIRVSFNAVDYTTHALNHPKSHIKKFWNNLELDFSHVQFLFYKPPTMCNMWPTSADINGKHLVILEGENIIDHGAPISVVFNNQNGLSKKVPGVVEASQIRCCTPAFSIGLADVFVSLNSQEYSKCTISANKGSRQQFLFYDTPTLNGIKPNCASIKSKSRIILFGSGFLDTGSIKVRFVIKLDARSEPKNRKIIEIVDGRLIIVDDVPAIACSSPILVPYILMPLYADVDFSLNGRDYTGPAQRLFFFTSYTLSSISPKTGAFGLANTLTIFFDEYISSDEILIRIRICSNDSTGDLLTDHTRAISWTQTSVIWKCPSFSNLVTMLELSDKRVGIEVAFDGQQFIDVGNLMDHFSLYILPEVINIWPDSGPADDATEFHLFGNNFAISENIEIRFSFNFSGKLYSKTVPSVFISKEQIACFVPDLCSFFDEDDALYNITLLPLKADVEISLCHSQFSPIPYSFTYITKPEIINAEPLAGFFSGGTDIHFSFKNSTHFNCNNVIIKFGEVGVGVKEVDEKTIQCTSPPLTLGDHPLCISYNGQFYSEILIETEENTNTILKSIALYHAFEPPTIQYPSCQPTVVGFGPISGNTPIRILGHGFTNTEHAVVKFVGNSENVVVPVSSIDCDYIDCMSPQVHAPGKKLLLVSCNGQQFTPDSGCYFEYHLPTVFEILGPSCGPRYGGTAIRLQIKNENGLPSNRELIECRVKFLDERGGSACIPASLTSDNKIEIVSPQWTHSCSTVILVSLCKNKQFVSTGLTFVFYSSPEFKSISPCAGPRCGGTCITIFSSKLKYTGEISVKFKLHGESNTGGVETQYQDCVIVKGTLVDGNISCNSPPVLVTGIVQIEVSLNGVDYLVIESKPTLKFYYYKQPSITSLSHAWGVIHGNTTIKVFGDNINNFGASLAVKFENCKTKVSKSVQGSFFASESSIECLTPAFAPGFYIVEISLNGQQFTKTSYSNPFSPERGNAKSIPPFRYFTPPFFISTPFAPASGGSRIEICGGEVLSGMLTKFDGKCQVVFSPVRMPLPYISSLQCQTNGAPEVVSAEVDCTNGIVLCRSPPVRFACFASVELLIGDGRSEAPAILPSKEKVLFYDPPIIKDVRPLCGPMSGETNLSIEGSHLFETDHVLIRFAYVAGNKSTVYSAVVPGKVVSGNSSSTKSGKSIITCKTPSVELKVRHNKGDYKRLRFSTDRIRKVCKRRSAFTSTTLFVDKSCLLNDENNFLFLDVMVDVSLNRGEQYSAKGITFRYYQSFHADDFDIYPVNFPLKLLATQNSFDDGAVSRQLFVRGNKSLKFADPHVLSIKFFEKGDNGNDIELFEVPGKFNEEYIIICKVPDFSNPGKISVHLSLNSQNFFYLDSIFLHKNIIITDISPKHSTIFGGHEIDSFICLSSILYSCFTNLIENSEKWKKVQDDIFSGLTYRSIEKKKRGKGIKCLSNVVKDVWNAKKSHLAYAYIVPNNHKILAQVVFTVYCKETKLIIQRKSINNRSYCVFDSSSWGEDKMSIVAAIPQFEKYSDFECSTKHMILGKTTQALLVKLPSTSQARLVFHADQLSPILKKFRFSVQLCDSSGNNINVLLAKSKKSPHDVNTTPYSVLLNSSMMANLDCKCLYLHVIAEKFSDEIQFYPDEFIELQLLIVDESGVVLELMINISDPCVWVCCGVDAKTLGIYYINQVYEELSKAIAQFSQTKVFIADKLVKGKKLGKFSSYNRFQHHVPSLKFGFKAINQVKSELIFSPVEPIQVGISNHSSSREYKEVHVKCVVPSIGVCGQIAVGLFYENICYSNIFYLNTYDPSDWSITKLSPSFGYFGSTPLLIYGNGLVETDNITVRFSTPTRYFDVQGILQTSKLLSLTIFSAKRLPEKDKNLATTTVCVKVGEKCFYTKCKKYSRSPIWNENFQLNVPDDVHGLSILVQDYYNSSPLDILGMVEIPLQTLTFGKEKRQWFALNSHSTEKGASHGEIELLLSWQDPSSTLSCVKCETPNIQEPCSLQVQLSSGLGEFFTKVSKAICFQVCNLPCISLVNPCFLPLTTGGDVSIFGEGFANSETLTIRMHFISNEEYSGKESERAIMSKTKYNPFIDLLAKYISPNEISVVIPCNPPTHRVTFSCSLDGHSFSNIIFESEKKKFAQISFFSIDRISPDRGPKSGKTKICLSGINLNVNIQHMEPVVKFEQCEAQYPERIIVEAKYSEVEKTICFFAPPSKIHSNEVNHRIEVSLDGPKGHFTNDNIIYKYYKTPTIKILPPLSGLIPGLSQFNIEVVTDEMFFRESTAVLRSNLVVNGQEKFSPMSVLSSKILTSSVPRYENPLTSNYILNNEQMLNLWIPNKGFYITILKARGLRALDQQSLCDPTVYLSFQNQTRRTEIKTKTLCPTFNEHFQFQVTSSNSSLNNLQIIVMDRDVNNRIDFMGCAKISVNTIIPRKHIRMWIPLRAWTDCPDMEVQTRGEIEVSFFYWPGNDLAISTFKCVSKMLSDSPGANKAANKNYNSLCSISSISSTVSRLESSVRFQNQLQMSFSINGQDYISHSNTSCYLALFPVILDIFPEWIPSSGGSDVKIHGDYFYPSKVAKAVFIWNVNDITELKNSLLDKMDKNNFSIVEAVVSSKFLITCKSPIPPEKYTDCPVLIMISINGVDINSVSIPQYADSHIENSTSVKGKVVQMDSGVRNYVYKTPLIEKIIAADGLYTTKIKVLGSHFPHTKFMIAKFTPANSDGSISDGASSKEAPIIFISSNEVECCTPFFNPQKYIQVEFSFNGLDFISNESCIFQIFNAPKLDYTLPRWICMDSNKQLSIYGENLAETNEISVCFTSNTKKQVSMTGTYSSGCVKCKIWQLKEILDTCNDTIVFVDLCLKGGKQYTKKPLQLFILKHSFSITRLFPASGPSWGGIRMYLLGENAIATNEIKVRFRCIKSYEIGFTEAGVSRVKPEDHTNNLYFDNEFVVDGKFENEGKISCQVPKVDHEGLVVVQVALNGVDYSIISSNSWYLVWQDWHKRATILPESLQNDGGARYAMSRYQEMKSKINFYTGSNQHQSQKLNQKHRGEETRKIYNTLPIFNRIKNDSSNSPVNLEHSFVDKLRGLEHMLGIKREKLVVKLKKLAQSSKTQKAFIEIINDTSELFFEPEDINSNLSVDCSKTFNFHILCERILPFLFPSCGDEEILETWLDISEEKKKTLSFQEFFSQLLSNRKPIRYSRDPGPGHYSPQSSMLEKTSLTFKIPTTPRLESKKLELPAIDANSNHSTTAESSLTRPRSRCTVFQKRTYSSLWCDPVRKEQASDPGRYNIDYQVNQPRARSATIYNIPKSKELRTLPLLNTIDTGTGSSNVALQESSVVKKPTRPSPSFVLPKGKDSAPRTPRKVEKKKTSDQTAEDQLNTETGDVYRTFFNQCNRRLSMGYGN